MTAADVAAPERPRAKRGRARELVAVSLTVGLVWYLLGDLPWDEIRSFVAGIHPLPVVVGIAVYALTYLFRAWRWRVLLGLDLRVRDLTVISAVHIMFNNVLPARLGELSYVALLKQRQGVGLAEGAVSLLVSRVLDLVSLGFIFVVSLSLLASRGISSGDLEHLPVAVAVLAGGLVAGLLGLKPLARIGQTLLRRTVLERFRGRPLVDRADHALDRLVTVLVRTGGPALYLWAGLLSVGIWLVKFGAFRLMIAGMPSETPIGLPKVIIGSTLAELTTVTPFHGIAGVGTYETAWKFAFERILGIVPHTAVLTGFGTHIVILLSSIVLGSLAYPWLRRMEPGSRDGRPVSRDAPRAVV